MELNPLQLVDDALASGATHAAIVAVDKINFVEDFRKACEQNTCSKYNTNWVCPPAVGTIAELRERACRYRQGLLFQTVHRLTDAFDWPGMMAAKKVHDGIFRRIVAQVRRRDPQLAFLALSAGACEVCPRCAYLDGEGCRFPEEAFASLEAYGIDVGSLGKACGIPYNNGRDTVSYVGLILFDAVGV